MTSAITGAVVSVVVVVSSEVVVVVLLSHSKNGSSPQEMTVRLKQEIRKMNKNFFIFSSILKVKYHCLVLGEPNIYQNLGDFSRIVGSLWRVV